MQVEKQATKTKATNLSSTTGVSRLAPIQKDVCVVGSGFGGGVAALRLTEAGQSVVVLERGDRWDGRGNSRQFQQTLGDLSYWMELFNIYAGADYLANSASAVVTGRGLGGGSLVYSMVSLRAPSQVFNDPVWPDEIDRAELDRYYDRAEDQLDVSQLQWAGGPGDDWKVVSKKDGAFADACSNVGVSCDPIPSTVRSWCGNLGWCTAGCVRGAKKSVDKMYLQPAEDQGALIRLGATATKISPGWGGRRWQVTYKQDGNLLPRRILADTVVIAAGAVGSPELLMKSASQLPGGISNQVGRNLSRGGDMLLFGVLPDDIGNLEPLETYKGKVIGVASFHYMFEPPPGFGPNWQKFILEPIMGLPPIASALVADPDGQTWAGDMRTFGVGPKHLMRKFGSRLLQVGVMGIDGMDGRVTLSGAGTPVISFNTNQATRNMWAAARAGFKKIIEDGAGGRMLPSWDQIRNDNFTIHPLGTCRMADTAGEGVLRHDCAVWKGSGSGTHAGLYVMDTSTFSSPIGVNTSLTAAAVAERSCDLILNG